MCSHRTNNYILYCDRIWGYVLIKNILFENVYLKKLLKQQNNFMLIFLRHFVIIYLLHTMHESVSHNIPYNLPMKTKIYF